MILESVQYSFVKGGTKSASRGQKRRYRKSIKRWQKEGKKEGTERALKEGRRRAKMRAQKSIKRGQTRIGHKGHLKRAQRGKI